MRVRGAAKRAGGWRPHRQELDLAANYGGVAKVDELLGAGKVARPCARGRCHAR